MSKELPAGFDPAGNLSTLIEAARGGCSKALGALLVACRPFLVRAAKNQLPADVREKESASDVVQKTLLDAQQGFGDFRGKTSEEFRGWMRRILHNNVLNSVRHYGAARRDVAREQPAGPAEPPANQPTPSAVAIDRERLEALERALARLPADYRQAILLHQQDGLPFAEVAARLGKTEEAARKLWARGIERLRQEMRSPDGSSR
jgi:RNA polymerase sigma-70 factor (ECF subfamily)